MTNTAFIPVRGGSKSIPLKNIKILNGKPLVWWTANAANNAECIDKVIIATDSPEIKRVIESFGLDKVEVYDRDPQNASDTASTESVMLEYIQKSGLKDDDLFFLIQATSPMLKSEHIDGMYEAFLKSGAASMFTGVREKNFHWQICPPCGGSGTECRRGVTLQDKGGYNHRYYAPYIKEFARDMRKEMTPQEVKLWQHIRREQLGVKFRRQYSIDNKYIADFVCLEKKIIIEVDGGQHCNSFEDVQRTFYLKKEGFRVVRFWNNEIDSNLDGCIEFLKREIKLAPPTALRATSPARGADSVKLHAEADLESQDKFVVSQLSTDDLSTCVAPRGGDGVEDCVSYCLKNEHIVTSENLPPLRGKCPQDKGGYNQACYTPVNYDYRNRPRRQDFEGLIAENGACYINSIGNIKRDKCRLSEKIAAYELPSYTAYEIDEEVDWIIVETLMNKLTYF